MNPHEDTDKWPSISVVIPNYNYGRTLGRAIESVVNQHYPKLELIVIDGGSTDDSLEVIRRYEPRINAWISEKDNGQSEAINKGLALCHGEVVNWLCSDDYLLPGALESIGAAFATGNCDVVVGKSRQTWPDLPEADKIVSCGPADLDQLPVSCPVPQPSCYFKRELLLTRSPYVRTDLNFAMDLELWCHLSKSGARWTFIDQMFSIFEMSASNKTAQRSWRQVDEHETVARDYLGGYKWVTRAYRRLYLPLECQIWSIKSESIRRFLWECDWKIKTAMAYGIGRPGLRYLLWSWCAPK